MSSSSNRRTWKGEPLVLFVEGYSDLTFYAEMLEHLGYSVDKYFIQDLGGKGRSFLEKEATLLLKPNQLAKMTHVAVILDADSNADSSFQSAYQSLKSVVSISLPAPAVWNKADHFDTKFGIFIAGSGPDQPELESLAWSAWANDQPPEGFHKCIHDFVECAKGKGQKIQSLDKVRIGAALAVLNEDDPRLGSGTRAKHINLDSPVFENLRHFFSAMKETK